VGAAFFCYCRVVLDFLDMCCVCLGLFGVCRGVVVVIGCWS